MSGHAQKFGGNFPQIFVVNFEKMKVVRKTPKFSKKVKISCIYKFLVVGNPQKLVPFLTVNKQIKLNLDIFMYFDIFNFS